MKNCISCEKKIELSKKFCGYCGTLQPQAELKPAKAKKQEPEVAPPKQKLPKEKTSRKKLAIVGVGIVGLGLVAGVVTLLLQPPSLSANDVSADFSVAGTSIHWAGDKVKGEGSITLKRNFSGDYHVTLESLETKKSKWIPVSDVTGKGPDFSIKEIVELNSGTNKYRLSIRRPGESSLLYSSKIFTVKTQTAHLPTQCPYKEFIEYVGPDSGMTMEPGQIDGNKIYCTMYPSQGGDYFLDLTYSKVSETEWDTLKTERYGSSVKLGLGETDAYSYSYSDELSGTYNKFSVNYHGIMIDSDWGQDGIKLAIQAIEVK